MNGLRVGLVCGHFDPARDGVADYTRQLARHLRSTRLDPLICTAHVYAQSADEEVIGVTERWSVGGVVRAARAMARLRLDLMHVQFAPSAFGFRRAVGLLPRLVPPGIPVLATLHEYGVWAANGVAGRLRSTVWSAVERRGFAERETLLLSLWADRLLVTAPEHELVLNARLPGRAFAAVRVPIGANIAVARLDRVYARAAVRGRIGLAADDLIAVFFGFLHPEKGLERLIEAVAQVRRLHPRLRLVLAGGMESHSVRGGAAVALRRELEDLARRYGVEDDVIFTGYLPEPVVSRLLLAADAAVYPFNAGVTAKSGSFLAALAHGVPTIATSRPGVVTGPTEIEGVLRVPPRDSIALTHALSLVLSDRALADRLARNGRACAEGLTWPAIAATHARIYAEVLEGGNRGVR
jgi:glycosyltransferase involved in cell wall biosynthesis